MSSVIIESIDNVRSKNVSRIESVIEKEAERRSSSGSKFLPPVHNIPKQRLIKRSAGFSSLVPSKGEARRRIFKEKEETDEMDRSLQIQKREYMSTQRIRKMHNVARSLLKDKINSLQSDYARESKQLLKETRNLENEMLKIGKENTQTEIPSMSRQTTSYDTTNNYSQGHSDLSIERSNTQATFTSSGCVKCQYSNSCHCRHFPCFLPTTYNSLGSRRKISSFSVLSNYDKFIDRCRNVRPESKTQLSDIECETPHRSPRLSIKEKERGLRQLVKEMRERNDKLKPPDWVTNYGKPVPRRMLLKPVVPVSELSINSK